ncbi:MAG TPA: hypothetical protein VFE14_20980 [Micromonosporaceae bacterium]|nr:hypothetical protein [Micromonosporaceae bacterium]
MSRRETEATLAAELLAELRYIRNHLTGSAEKRGTGVVNHVLEVATRLFDTDGLITMSFGVPCGSIEVNNVGNATVTVASGPPTGTGAPAKGVGVYKVAAGTTQWVNVNHREVTLWGTAAQNVSYQAYTVGTAVIPGIAG